MNQQREKKSRIARDILKLDRNTLMVNLRFMDMALSRLILMEHDELSIATDGQYFVYNPSHILKVFKNEKEASVREYLHVVFHCVYCHMFLHTLLNQDLWNLACDIAVEKTINDLGIKSTAAKRSGFQLNVLNQLEQEIKVVTAEKVYYHYLNQQLSKTELSKLEELFKVDDHTLWYMNEEQKNNVLGIGDDSQQEDHDNKSGNSSKCKTDSDLLGSFQQLESSLEDIETDSDLISSFQQLENTWKDISEHMQIDLETFSKEQGDKAGGLVQNLREVNREKYNYEAFLRRFAVRGEVMKVDMDEFDYIFYTYGLKLYGNVPLIEPLEYKEVKRIKEFVIAIDTSGSTSGELVQTFLQKTYNILKSEESFFSKINIHIIQCDTVIQEDKKITNQDEFDQYIKQMKIRGLGGTDFRPVFDYVDKLNKEKEFQNLKGLIYFTDGWGDFPNNAPQYDTAFVFVDDGFNNYDVPSWAMKLVLQREEIYDMQKL